MSQSISFRSMSIEDADACHKLSSSVSWAHRVEDWSFIINLGKGFVAEEDGKIIATGLRLSDDKGHTTLGMIIVAPNSRGQGVAKKIMEILLEQSGQTNLRLYSTKMGQTLYEKYGFFADGYATSYQGVPPNIFGPISSTDENLHPVTLSDRETLYDLDHQATGLSRRTALDALLKVGKAVILEQRNTPVGYSILRPFGLGQVVGPVIAPDPKEARILIEYWFHIEGGKHLRIDLLDGTGLDNWLIARGLISGGTAVAMSRGNNPTAAGPAKLFALISQALG